MPGLVGLASLGLAARIRAVGVGQIRVGAQRGLLLVRQTVSIGVRARAPGPVGCLLGGAGGGEQCQDDGSRGRDEGRGGLGAKEKIDGGSSTCVFRHGTAMQERAGCRRATLALS